MQMLSKARDGGDASTQNHGAQKKVNEDRSDVSAGIAARLGMDKGVLTGIAATLRKGVLLGLFV